MVKFGQEASGAHTSDAEPLDGAGIAALNPLGRRAFIAGVTAAGATVALSSNTAEAASVPAGASYYEALEPRRLADTRTYAPYAAADKNFQRISPNQIRIQVAGRDGIPADAVAAVISIAAIGNGLSGWVRATPAGQDSIVANVLLDPPDGVVTNLATVKLSADGYVDILGYRNYDVIVDISGVYRPTTTKRRGGRLKHLPNVLRLANGTPVGHNGKLVIPFGEHVGVPASADAVVVNLTAAFATGNGYLTAYPNGLASPPNVSNVNYDVGETRGAGSIVKLGTANGVRGIEVYLYGGASVYADLAGYITGASDEESEEGLFVPIQPVRLLDTRRKADIAKAGGKRRLWPEWTRPFEIPDGASGFPSSAAGVKASGVAMNITSVASMNSGYITVLPAQTERREVSNLNISRAGQTVANHVISQASTAGIECYSRWGAHVVCDVGGWYVGEPQAVTKGAPIDPEPPGAELPWTLSVPRMGMTHGVYEGAPNPIVNSGNSWHWSGTGKVGQTAAIVVFGHRTEAGGPYRQQHQLVAGDRLYVSTPDQRYFTYVYTRRELTSALSNDILDASRRVGGQTFTLVACSKTNWLPTDLAWRIVSTFALESWQDVSPTID